MKALVVYTCVDYKDNYKTKVDNIILNFKGDLPTVEEINDIQEKLHSYPYICSPKIVNIVRLEG